MLRRHYKCAFYIVICGIFITSLLSDLSLRVVTYDRTVVIVSGRVILTWLLQSSYPPRRWWGTSIRNYLWMGSLGCVTGFLEELGHLDVPGRKIGSMVIGSMVYNLLINGVYWSYNPVTNHVVSFWDIQVWLVNLPPTPNESPRKQGFNSRPC